MILKVIIGVLYDKDFKIVLGKLFVKEGVIKILVVLYKIEREYLLYNFFIKLYLIGNCFFIVLLYLLNIIVL